MAAPAFTVLQWATAAPPASTVLPAQLRLDGYAAYDLLTSVQVNRLLYEVGEWLDYLNTEGAAAFAIEHYPTATADAYAGAIAAGSHEDIICDSLVIRGEGTGAGEGGRLVFRDAGRASDNTATIFVGAALAEPVILKIDNTGSATRVELELEGGVFRSTLAGSAAWAMEVSSGSNQTFYVRNTGAGVADLDVDGGLNVQAAAAVAGLLTANDGVTLEPYPVDNSFVRYSSVQTFELDISPYAGGWVSMIQNGSGAYDTLTMYIGATPPYVEPTGTAYVPLIRPLVMPVNTTTALNASARRTITQVKLRYYRNNADDHLHLELVRVARDGAGAESVLLDYDQTTEFATTGAWTLFDSGTIAATPDPGTYFYFWRLTLQKDTDMRVADVTVEYTERHIQAPGM